jgi:DNA-binding protein
VRARGLAICTAFNTSNVIPVGFARMLKQWVKEITISTNEDKSNQ